MCVHVCEELVRGAAAALLSQGSVCVSLCCLLLV